MATAVSGSQIDLRWMDSSSNETNFRIYRCKGEVCTNWKPIASAGANVTTFSDRGLSSKTTYRYRVVAYNALGDSAFSNIAKATTTR